MKKKYEVSGNLSFMVDPVEGPWIDPTGGGFINAEFSPEREEFLTNAGFIREVIAAEPPATINKKKAAEE